MSSRAFIHWDTTSRSQLDELEAVHRRAGGVRPGRRFALEQLNHSYLAVLGGHFQRFCRDLHTEVAQELARAVPQEQLRRMLLTLLTDKRRLDRGNAVDGGLSEDFGRFDLQLWAEVKALDRRNGGRRHRLGKLNSWRDAVVHQDFKHLQGERLQLRLVQRWRADCDQLAMAFDAVLGRHVGRVVGTTPW